MQPDEDQEDPKDVGRSRSKYINTEKETTALGEVHRISPLAPPKSYLLKELPSESAPTAPVTRKLGYTRAVKACDPCRLMKSRVRLKANMHDYIMT